MKCLHGWLRYPTVTQFLRLSALHQLPGESRYPSKRNALPRPTLDAGAAMSGGALTAPHRLDARLDSSIARCRGSTSHLV